MDYNEAALHLALTKQAGWLNAARVGLNAGWQGLRNVGARTGRIGLNTVGGLMGRTNHLGEYLTSAERAAHPTLGKGNFVTRGLDAAADWTQGLAQRSWNRQQHYGNQITNMPMGKRILGNVLEHGMSVPGTIGAATLGSYVSPEGYAGYGRGAKDGMYDGAARMGVATAEQLPDNFITRLLLGGNSTSDYYLNQVAGYSPEVARRMQEYLARRAR